MHLAVHRVRFTQLIFKCLFYLLMGRAQVRGLLVEVRGQLCGTSLLLLYTGSGT